MRFLKQLALYSVLCVALSLSGYTIDNAERLKTGAQAFQFCSGCHTLNPEAPNLMGPHLYGILDRPVASVKGFDYSKAMKEQSGVWSRKALSRYIARPRHAVPRNDMPYNGLLSPHARSDLLDYLTYIGQQPAVDTPDNVGATIERGDVEKGILLARPCLRCHVIDPELGNSIGPNLFGVVGRPVASAEGFEYSNALRKRGGIWDTETLNAFIYEAKDFTQGTHLAFAKLKRVKDRADIIAWLASLK